MCWVEGCDATSSQTSELACRVARRRSRCCSLDVLSSDVLGSEKLAAGRMVWLHAHIALGTHCSGQEGLRSTHVRRAYSIWLYAYVRYRRFCQSASIRAYIQLCRVRWGVTLRDCCCRVWGCGGTRCWWGSSKLSGAAYAGTKFQASTLGSCDHALCMWNGHGQVVCGVHTRRWLLGLACFAE